MAELLVVVDGEDKDAGETALGYEVSSRRSEWPAEETIYVPREGGIERLEMSSLHTD